MTFDLTPRHVIFAHRETKADYFISWKMDGFFAVQFHRFSFGLIYPFKRRKK